MLSKPLLLLSALTAITAALPVDPAIQPRVCGIVNLPSTIIQLQQATPDTSFPNTAYTNDSVLISQDNSGGALLPSRT